MGLGALRTAGRSGRLSTSPVHVARLHHPSHLALGFRRAILRNRKRTFKAFKETLQDVKLGEQTGTDHLISLNRIGNAHLGDGWVHKYVLCYGSARLRSDGDSLQIFVISQQSREELFWGEAFFFSCRRKKDAS